MTDYNDYNMLYEYDLIIVYEPWDDMRYYDEFKSALDINWVCDLVIFEHVLIMHCVVSYERYKHMIFKSL